MKTYRELISERVLSIGINPSHENLREKHRQEIHDMIQKSYSKIGGYSGRTPGSEENPKLYIMISLIH